MSHPPAIVTDVNTPAFTAPPAESLPVTVIGCDGCVAADTPACTDCLVTFLCDPDGSGAVVVDVVEARAVRLLQAAGLVPPHRHRPAPRPAAGHR